MNIVEALIDEKWPGVAPVIVNQGGAVPQDLATYATITYPFAKEDQIELGPSDGNRMYQVDGGFVFTLNIARGLDVKQYLETIDAFRASLRGYVSEDGHFRLYGINPAFINNESDHGAYFQISVGIEYEHNVFG
jgi:hypothetical protein